MVIGPPPARLGIDIAPDAIRIAAIARSSDGLRLISSAMVTLGGDELRASRIANTKTLAEALQTATEALGIPTRDATLSVFGDQTWSKVIAMPQMTEDELAEQIGWEIDQYLPFDKADFALEYRVLPGEASSGQMRVAVSGLARAQFDELVAVGRAAGLKVRAVELVSEGLRRAYALAEVDVSTSVASPVAMVDLSGPRITCVVLVGGEAVFSKALDGEPGSAIARALGFFAATEGHEVTDVVIAGAGAERHAAALGGPARAWRAGPLLECADGVATPSSDLAVAAGLAMPAPKGHTFGAPKRRGWLGRLFGRGG